MSLEIAAPAFSFLLEKAWNLAMKWQNSSNEKRELNLILRQVLRKFIMDWEQSSSHHIGFPTSVGLKWKLREHREQILELTVNVEHLIEPELRDKLYELTGKMQGGVMALDAFGSPRTEEFGNESKELANHILDKYLLTNN